MKTWHSFIFFIFVCLINISGNLFGSNKNLINIGFENGNFNGWTGYTWRYSTEVPSINTSKVAGIVTRRHTIMSDTTAYDLNTGNALKIIPQGYKYSAKLGDAIISSDSNPRGWEQSLQYKLTVDDTNSLLIMKFACVLEYASDHTALMEPRFKLSLYDASGNTINTCTNYDVYSTSTNAKGFQTYTPTGSSSPVKWRDWTTVGANLSAYKGQTITIEFMSADCTGRYHFGYAYFVTDYQPMKISTNFCGTSDTAKLTAPAGFESYKWRDLSTNQIVNSDTTLATISVPMTNKDSAIYRCILRSATGCVDSLSTTILNYRPVASFDAAMTGTCTDNLVQFTNKSTTNRGILNFAWDYGDGTSDSIATPTHIHHYSTSGRHTVTLTVDNQPSTCSVDTVKAVESINVDLVGLRTDKDSICIGSSTGKLIANGAWSYKWSTDSTLLDTSSIKTNLPIGSYWVIGYNSAYNCYSNKHYASIYQETDWQASISGRNWFCAEDSTLLLASGSFINTNNQAGNAKRNIHYFWSNGVVVDSAYIKTPGSHSVILTDEWGCTRNASLTVNEKSLPLVDFRLSPTTINAKYNTVTCTINQEPNVAYTWTFGDNMPAEHSNYVIHPYSSSLPSSLYLIVLKDSDMIYGCTNTASAKILMEPFVPNVFTPNGDTHNDYFMPHYNLQIFDRYGILLYSGSKESYGWDGIYKGKEVSPDTYFYIMHFTDYQNQPQTKKGYVTLIR